MLFKTYAVGIHGFLTACAVNDVNLLQSKIMHNVTISSFPRPN